MPFGIRGPGSFLVDLSMRYQLPLGGRLDSLDFFFDVFNVFNRLNEVAPTGNRSSPNFLIADLGPVPAAVAARHPAAVLRPRSCGPWQLRR